MTFRFPFAFVDGIHGALERANGFVQLGVIFVLFVGVLQNVIQQENHGGESLQGDKEDPNEK